MDSMYHRRMLSCVLLLTLLLWAAMTPSAVRQVQAQPSALHLGDLSRGNLFQAFAGGSGTGNDPYLIATAAQLDDVRNHLDAHFRLIADINLGVAPWNEGEGWQPIGAAATPFTGVFDGDIYVIFNLVIDRPATPHQGLFGYLSGATVENLYLENANVQGGQYTGGLAGRADNSDLAFIRLHGQVAGGSDTGGVVGYMSGGSLGQATGTAAVQSGSLYTGGLVGRTVGAALVYQSASLGTVVGGQYTGGLVGYHSGSATVADCYSRAAVSGSREVGGLVGYMVGLRLDRSYSTGAVTASTTTNVGDLVGGRGGGTVTDCYWDTETSGQDTSADGAGSTTAQMREEATFANWDFDDADGEWAIIENTTYPYHRQTAGSILLYPTSSTHRNSASYVLTITVTSNVTWTAKTDDIWIAITGGATGMDDGIITYTVATNPDHGQRVGSIIVSSDSGEITRTFTVRQGEFLTIAPPGLNHHACASSGHAVSVTSNAVWTATTDDAWISLTAGDSGVDDGTVTYRVEANLSLAPRAGSITISGGEITHTFTVTQAGALPYLSTAPDYHAHGWGASAGHQLTVEANIPWTAATDDDWLTITSSSSSTGDGMVSYSVAANETVTPRLGYITVSDGDRTWPLRVHQALSWAIALSADPVAGGTVAGAGHYAHEEVLTVTATASPVWDFVAWTEDDVEVSTDAAYVFTATRNRALTANFLRHTGALSVTLEPEMARDAGAQWSIDAGNTWHDSGDGLILPTGTYTVTFSALAAWDAPADTPVEVVKDGATTLTGTYTLKQYTLTLLADPVAGGEVAGAGIYEHGQQAIITATANLGWTFAGWTGDVVSGINPLNLTVTDHLTVTATFSQDEYTLEVDTVGEGEVGVTPEQATYVYGDVIALTATAAPGWTFVAWSGDVTGSTAQITHTITGNTAVIATFSQDVYSLAISVEGAGVARREPDQAAYTYGQVITLTAVADPGWTFVAWSGDVTGSTAQITHIITGNTAVTATFSQDGLKVFIPLALRR